MSISITDYIPLMVIAFVIYLVLMCDRLKEKKIAGGSREKYSKQPGKGSASLLFAV